MSYLEAATADDGGEDGAGGVVTGETSLAHVGAIVHNQGNSLVITHVGGVLRESVI